MTGAAIGVVVIAAGSVFAQTSSVDQVLQADIRRLELAQESQERINAVVEGTRSLADDYRSINKEIDGLKVYNRLMTAQTNGQQATLDDITLSMEQVDVINRQIFPLMERMIDGVEQSISLDIPFLMSEREKRVNDLKDIMERSDVSVAEKFRKVMEAYQIESGLRYVQRMLHGRAECRRCGARIQHVSRRPCRSLLSVRRYSDNRLVESRVGAIRATWQRVPQRSPQRYSNRTAAYCAGAGSVAISSSQTCWGSLIDETYSNSSRKLICGNGCRTGSGRREFDDGTSAANSAGAGAGQCGGAAAGGTLCSVSQRTAEPGQRGTRRTYPTGAKQ